MNDRETLVELIGKSPYGARKFADCFFRETIEQLADHLIANGVTVQKQGEWDITEDDWLGLTLMKCSSCGEEYCFEAEADEIPLANYNYCPNCGAKMEKKDGECES